MTNEQQWLARKYIAYRTLINMWFVGAIWLYFYRLFITEQQVGILDGLAFAIGLLAEVPSGALADKFGRDRTVKLGQLLSGSGFLIQSIASSFLLIFIGQMIMMIGYALVSGADDALFFERLKFDKNSNDWRKLVTRASQMALVGSLFAYVIGGWTYSIEPRIPWVLNGIAFISSAIVIWSVKDMRPKKARQKFLPEIKDYLLDIKTGFAQFKTPKLLIYIPFILTVQGLFYASSFGLLRLIMLDRFHFSPFWGSVVVASSSLITVGILSYMHKNADKLLEKKVLLTIGLIAISSLVLSIANIGFWGYIVILAIYASEQVLNPYMSEVLNTHSPENQRATVLSVASFFKSLPYVLLAPIIGYLNTHKKIEYFFIIWAVAIFIALLVYLSAKKRDSFIALP